jgi:hypothetical protein
MIIQPFSYFGQPVTAGGAGFIVRPDVYASSVTVAIPGTQFGSTFGQTDFRSDISGYINGGTSLTNAQMPLTGSGQTTSTSTNFPTVPYDTSMERTDDSNMGSITGSLSNVDFGTDDFTVEGWFNTAATGDNFVGFGYTNGLTAGWGFFGRQGTLAGGRIRWVATNASNSERVGDFTVALTANAWVHIAFSRSGNTWYGAYNGFIRRLLTLSGAVGTSAPTEICGRSPDGAGAPTARYQDFRITKGVARYTGALNSTYTIPESIVMAG